MAVDYTYISEELCMGVHYNKKGKYFTDIVTKDTVEVVIGTQDYRIRGEIYLRQGERLIDELNKCKQFIAVTNAQVLDKQGESLYRTDFMVINQMHILWMIPKKEIQSNQGS
jgi:hypothetical protein